MSKLILTFLAKFSHWKGDANEARKLALIVHSSKNSKKNVRSHAETLLKTL